MKKVLAVFVFAIVAVVGVLLVAPSFIDWTQHKEKIVSQLHDRTGLDYEISGNVELAIIPYPRVVVEGLKVTNPEYSDATLLTLDRLDVAIALAPLFSGLVTVDSIALIKPQITLETDIDGRNSWETEQMRSGLQSSPARSGDQDAVGSFSLADAVSLDSIVIKDGRILYSQKADKKTYDLNALNTTLRADTIKGPYSVAGDLEYNKELVEFKAELGRIKDQAPLQVELDLKVPKTNSEIGFSGLVDAGEKAEIQGQLHLQTDDLSSLIELATAGAPVDAVRQPVTMDGLLTLNQSRIALQNATLGLSGQQINGQFLASGLDRAKAGEAVPVKIEATAKAPFDLTKILAQLGGKESATKRVSFIPETITMPMPLQAEISFAAPSMLYQGKTISDVKLSGAFKDAAGNFSVSAKLPGATALSVEGGLKFASLSRSQATGSVTYSDPLLNYTSSLQAEQGAQFATFAVPGDAGKKMANILAGKLSVQAKGTVSPSTFNIDSSRVLFPALDANLSGSYELAKSRDKAAVTIQTQAIDLDVWADRLGSADKGVPGAKTESSIVQLQKMASSLAVPFDFEGSLTSSGLVFKGASYNSLVLKAGLTDKAFSLSTLELKDERGQKILAGGTISDVKALSGIKLNTQVVTPDMNGFLAGVMEQPPKLPSALNSMNIVSAFEGSLTALDFTSNIKSGEGQLDAKGTVKNLSVTPDISALTLRLRHPNYVDLVQILSPSYRSNVAIKKAVDIYGVMNQDAGIYRFENIKAIVGPSTLSGTLSFDKSKDKPSLKADLSADVLPLDNLLGHDAAHKGSVRAQPLRESNGARWSRNAIETGWMNLFNADIDIKAGTFSYGPWVFSNAVLDVMLVDGTLTLNKVGGGIHGGTALLSGKAVSTGNERMPLSVSGEAALTSISLEQFIKTFSGNSLVQATGTIDFNTALESRGASPSSLIYGLQGTGAATGKDIVFSGFDLARLSALLANPSSSMTENLNTLLSTTMSGGTTKFDTLDVAYTAKEGVLNFDKLSLDGPSAIVTGEGKVNLPLWTIDLKTIIALKEPADAPTLDVRFAGPLDRPAKTFGKDPLQGYFQNLIGNEFNKVLQNELKDSGVFKKLGIEVPTQNTAPTTGTDTGATEGEAAPSTGSQAAPTQQQPQSSPKEVKPEEVLEGILKGVLGGR